MKDIIIFGDDGAGKSTLAKSLNMVQTHYQIIPLAQVIREELSKANPGLDFYSKPTPPSIRQMMIDYAQDVKKKRPYHFCLEVLKRREHNRPIIIDDARFLVEYLFFKKHDFFFIGLQSAPSGNIYSEECRHIVNFCDVKWFSQELRPDTMAKLVFRILLDFR